MTPEDTRAREFNAAKIAEIIAAGYRGPVHATHYDGSVELVGRIDANGEWRPAGGDDDGGEGR